MHTVTAREANQNFSRLLGAAEAGETVVITKNGKTVAELRPRTHDKRDDPEWVAAHEAMVRLMSNKPDDGFRVGKITLEDKYGNVA